MDADVLWWWMIIDDDEIYRCMMLDDDDDDDGWWWVMMGDDGWWWMIGSLAMSFLWVLGRLLGLLGIDYLCLLSLILQYIFSNATCFFKNLGTRCVFWKNGIDIIWNNAPKVAMVKQLMTGIRSFLWKWHNAVIPPIYRMLAVNNPESVVTFSALVLTMT